MIRYKNVRIDINNKLDLKDVIIKKLKINSSDLIDYKIHKQVQLN